MKAIVRNVVLALGAIALLASCDLFKKDEVFVSISSDSPSFVDGKVTLKISLSPASSKEVQVTLSDSGNIPAGALSYAKAFPIPAGAAFANVDVEVDVDQVPAGVYSVTFAIAEANGAKIDPSAKECSVNLSIAAQAPPQVFISNSSEAFVDGKAKFTVALDRAINENVTVNFEVLTDVEGYLPVAAEALSFSNPATIPAGSTSAEVEVTLDESKVTKGVSQFAVIAIKSAVNAELAATKTKAYIEATFPLAANKRSDWTVSFDGEVAAESGTAHGVSISGLGENDAYYLFIYQEGLVAKYFGEDVTKYIESMSGYVAEAMGTEDAYYIRVGSKQWLFNPFSVGNYEVWILGCNAAGYLTGDYGVGSFKIEPSAEVVEAYNKWLGEWNVSRQSVTDKWVISENVPGASFYIQGIDGTNSVIADIQVEADYDAANDAIVLYAQDCKEWTYQNKTYTVGLLGLYAGTNLVSGNFDLGTITRTGENAATITSGGSQVTLSSGTYEVSGMTFFAYDETGNGYVFNSQTFYQWPETMNKIVADNNDPVYNALLGNWNIKRNDSEWDKDASKYVQKGEVSDTWTIYPKVAGNSFYISGIEGYSDLVIVADYDKASGTFSVSEQSIAVGDYSFGFLGLFYFPGNANYQAGNYIYDDGAKLFTAKKDGDSIVLTSCPAGTYGNFLGMQTFRIDGEDYYDLHEEGYALPNTLTKATSSSAPRKAAKCAGKSGVNSFSSNNTQMRHVSAPARGTDNKGKRIERNLPV